MDNFPTQIQGFLALFLAGKVIRCNLLPDPANIRSERFRQVNLPHCPVFINLFLFKRQNGIFQILRCQKKVKLAVKICRVLVWNTL